MKNTPCHAFLKTLSTLTLIAYSSLPMNAAPKDTNYDEAKVPAYTPPDPLLMNSGTPVTSSHQWTSSRRGEILELFREHVYGHSPASLPAGISHKITKTVPNFLNGKATMKEIRIFFTGKEDGPKMDILLIIPNKAVKPVPTFLGLNFGGNHSVHPDPRITLSKAWMRPKKTGIIDNKATEAARGSTKRWPLETIINRGYALATIYYGDIDPDFDDDFQNGLQPIFYRKGQTKPAANE